MPYVLLYLYLVCVELAYLENSAILKWFSLTKFSISFTTACVEVKSCIQKMIVEKREWTKSGHFGRHSTARHSFLFLHIGKNVIQIEWQRILLLTNRTIVNSIWIRETSLFAYLELQILQSVFSIPLEFEIVRLACILQAALLIKLHGWWGL